uniref:Uncharacterized protein n=1 Tax=Tanacetum cinerariifolium TaxID=118510 RepID=A0A6L2KHN4_TANCI|nr:hypothetical protein [Tanacetum cinerariifolium]
MVDSGWDGVVLQLGCWRRLWTGTKGVAARGVVDLIDREKGCIFGVRQKSSSEKFFGGDGWSGRRTAAGRIVYSRRSVEKRKDKGKAIVQEDESVPKKSKKQQEKERLGHEEAIRLQEQIDEEERKRIARDAKIAIQLQEEINKAGQ